MSKTLHPISIRRVRGIGSVVIFAFKLKCATEYQAGQYVTLKLATVEDPQGPATKQRSRSLIVCWIMDRRMLRRAA